MSASAAAFLTYLWHYMLARLLYDDLARPLLHGHVPVTLPIVAGAAVVFALGRRAGRRT
jgi:uncharacterized membrane protein YdjX (TVP38/TMEM64 family)